MIDIPDQMGMPGGDAPDAELPPEPSRWSGLATRSSSAAVLAAIALGALFIGGWIFTLFVMIVAMLMVKEWNGLTENFGPGWRFAGLFYVAIPCASLIWLRGVNFQDFPHAGMRLTLYLLFSVWATDIGAYFAGRKFGGAKMAPTISPGKTWAGLAGGAVSAAIVGGLSSMFTPYPSTILACAGLALALALISQASDLFESWLKRRAGVKDSGTLIPGHGGILDRVDGLMFTTPLFAWLVWLSGRALV